MRNREVIEREIYRAREDLETSLAELKHVVQEKVDVRARARVAVARGKATAQEAIEQGKAKAQELLARGKVGAHDLAVRGKDGAHDVYIKAKDGAHDVYIKAKDRPQLLGAIVGGIVLLGALVFIGRRREWFSSSVKPVIKPTIKRSKLGVEC